jgi:hypothetical protein
MKMMNIAKCLIAAMALMGTGKIHAQTTIAEGQNYFNVGLGLGPYFYGGAYRSSFLIPVSGYWAFKQVGPGVFAAGVLTGLGFYSWTETLYDGRRASRLGIAIPAVARLRYHYDWGVKNLDTHAGISLGIGLQTSHSLLHVVGGLHIGAQYFFTDKLGAYAEIGWDVTNLCLGLSVKLK